MRRFFSSWSSTQYMLGMTNSDTTRHSGQDLYAIILRYFTPFHHQRLRIQTLYQSRLTCGSGSWTARRSATGGCSLSSTCGSSWTGCQIAARTETPSRTPHPNRSYTACPDSAALRTLSPCLAQRPSYTSGNRQQHQILFLPKETNSDCLLFNNKEVSFSFNFWNESF